MTCVLCTARIKNVESVMCGDKKRKMINFDNFYSYVFFFFSQRKKSSLLEGVGGLIFVSDVFGGGGGGAF